MKGILIECDCGALRRGAAHHHIQLADGRKIDVPIQSSTYLNGYVVPYLRAHGYEGLSVEVRAGQLRFADRTRWEHRYQSERSLARLCRAA